MRMIPTFLKLMCVAGAVIVAGDGCRGESEQANFVVADTPRDTAMIDSIPSCERCSVSIIDSVRLGTPADALIPVRPPGFLRDSRAQFYLSFNGWSGQPILRYDAAGQYRGRVGADGRGPGEYEMTDKVMLDPSDSLFVFENGGLIGQVFSADGKYARRYDLKGSMPFAVTAEKRRRSLGVQREHWPPRPGAQLVLRYDNNGSVTDSFPIFSFKSGAKGRVSRGDEAYPYEAVVNSAAYAAPDGSVWTMAYTNYRLEQHDTNGVARKLFGVRVAGEPEPILRVEDVKNARPSGSHIPTIPVIRSKSIKRVLQPRNWVDVDTSGLLWVTRQIPAPSWDTVSAKKMYDSREAPDEEFLPRDIEDRLYHTAVEVIDPRVGQLLTRLVVPFKGERVGPGFIGRVTANDAGYYLPTVYRLQFKRP